MQHMQPRSFDGYPIDVVAISRERNLKQEYLAKLSFCWSRYEMWQKSDKWSLALLKTLCLDLKTILEQLFRENNLNTLVSGKHDYADTLKSIYADNLESEGKYGVEYFERCFQNLETYRSMIGGIIKNMFNALEKCDDSLTQNLQEMRSELSSSSRLYSQTSASASTSGENLALVVSDLGAGAVACTGAQGSGDHRVQSPKQLLLSSLSEVMKTEGQLEFYYNIINFCQEIKKDSHIMAATSLSFFVEDIEGKALNGRIISVKDTLQPFFDEIMQYNSSLESKTMSCTCI